MAETLIKEKLLVFNTEFVEELKEKIYHLLIYSMVIRKKRFKHSKKYLILK